MKQDPFKTYKLLRLALPFSFAFLFITVAMINPTGLAALVIIGLWSLMNGIIFIYFLTFKCPNCKKTYCFKVGFISLAWPFYNHCLHCNLPLGIKK
jgi:hypothetical protein